MTLLEVADVTKTFPDGRGGATIAVDRVSLTIAEGESVGLVGESGSGKSTLSRLICGLASPDSGSIRLRGGLPRNNRGAVQMVFQSADEALNPAFSVARNIGVGLGLSAMKAEAAVHAIAEQVGLSPELLTRRPHQLSGGQQARAGIARALISSPDLLLLDEPTAALDVSVQALVLRLLHRIRTEIGCSMLLVSHDLDVVRLMCERIVVIYRGRIVEEGSAEQITGSPQHPYTRSLLAAMPGAGRPKMPVRPDGVAEIRPDACHFRESCPIAEDICGRLRPELAPAGLGRRIACHAFAPKAAQPVNESGACSPR